MTRTQHEDIEPAGKWIARFLTSHLAAERGCSPQTSSSYRDVIKLLLVWFRDEQHIPPEKLRLADIDRVNILQFLNYLETVRGNSAATRNQRLAVIKSFTRYASIERPEYLGQAAAILAIRQKRPQATQPGYLSADEVKTLLSQPDPANRKGFRDMNILSVLYDTGCRVQELCDLNVADIRLTRPVTAVLHGKGSKTRQVPLMGATADLVNTYLARRPSHPGLGADADPLFTGPNHRRLTRWAVTKILARHVQSARDDDPTYAPGLNISPHVIRRSRAMHLLEAGVNLIYIRDLLGHADVSTTEIYARANTQAKHQAIEAAYQSLTPQDLPDWTTDTPLLNWLETNC